jgi:hypothetical protein
MVSMKLILSSTFLKCAVAISATNFAIPSVHAMTFQADGSTLYATGPVENDYAKFKDALDKPGLERIVFVNSPGGDLWTGMRIGRMIAEKDLHTVIAGYCVSACSIMFMGGKVRTFSDALRPTQTYVGFHGPHNKLTKAVSTEQSPQIYAFVKTAMGEKFNSDIMNRAFYDMEDAGALLRVFDDVRTAKTSTYHCKSALTQRKDCTEFKGASALSLGITTSSELTKLNLPNSMQPVLAILGASLNVPISDKDAFLEKIVEKTCTSDICKKLVRDYVGSREHSAMALPLEGPGIGTVWGKDSPTEAMISSVFSCNHGKDRPSRLCTVVVVNGFDMQSQLPGQRAAHEAAVAALNVPRDKYYANEQFGGGLAAGTAMRYNSFTDATPTKTEGVRVFGTQELATAIKGGQALVVLDAGSSEDVLPGSKALLYGGTVSEDAAKDAALEQRIHGLLKLLAPDPAVLLVVTGASRDDWRSYNAAMRARKLGYSQVGWYRGGLVAWKAANLPTAKIIVNAVAN